MRTVGLTAAIQALALSISAEAWSQTGTKLRELQQVTKSARSTASPQSLVKKLGDQRSESNISAAVESAKRNASLQPRPMPDFTAKSGGDPRKLAVLQRAWDAREQRRIKALKADETTPAERRMARGRKLP